jgi:uncharacterized membrane protein
MGSAAQGDQTMKEGEVSNSAKWAASAILAIVGVLAIAVAVIYVAVSIHSLPSFIPGKHVGVNGHYHKRAAIAGVIGIVLLALSGVIVFRSRQGAATPSEVATPSE